jgi:hypothetical protein
VKAEAVMPPMAQISEAVRPLTRAISKVAITPYIIDLGTQAGADKRRDLNECSKESGNFIVNTSD